jgi:F-type H+-transporting ATPase subunit alpha
MKNFEYYLKTIGEYGEVVELMPALVSVAGLPNARPFEIVLFESGAMGQIFSIGTDGIEIVLFSKTPVLVGERVARTNEILSLEVSESLLGSVISPLGDNLFGSRTKSDKTETRPIEKKPPGIMNRAGIKTPLHSGITLVDLLLPLGKGQKQLVIGDRKTGKTSFLLTTVKKQIEEGSLVVYGAIARKQSDIQKLLAFFKKEKIEQSIVTVLTTSHDSPALIYLTPFAAMTIAEYFRDQGRDVLVVLDDLSSHAKFYREMSLVGRRFPRT